MAGPITSALERWKQGDHDAQFDLERELRPFLQEMIRLVRQNLDTPLKPRIDSHGVVYAAFHSFLTGVAKDEFPALNNHVELKKVLTTLVSRTLRDEIDWHRRKRRTPYQEQRQAANSGPSQADPKEIPAPENLHVPSFAIWLEDFLRVMRGAHPMAIEIVSLSLDGLSNQEIKDELGLGLRTVQKIKQTLLEKWQEATKEEV